MKRTYATPPPVALYRYIVDYKRAHDGNSPTLREIVDAGLASSTSVADYRLAALEEAGLIRRPCSGARTIEVVGATWSPPARPG